MITPDGGGGSARREVEVELRCDDSVRHAWVHHRPELHVGARVRLVEEDSADPQPWWTVTNVFGERWVPNIDGTAFAATDDPILSVRRSDTRT